MYPTSASGSTASALQFQVLFGPLVLQVLSTISSSYTTSAHRLHCKSTSSTASALQLHYTSALQFHCKCSPAPLRVLFSSIASALSAHRLHRDCKYSSVPLQVLSGQHDCECSPVPLLQVLISSIASALQHDCECSPVPLQVLSSTTRCSPVHYKCLMLRTVCGPLNLAEVEGPLIMYSVTHDTCLPGPTRLWQLRMMAMAHSIARYQPPTLCIRLFVCRATGQHTAELV